MVAVAVITDEEAARAAKILAAWASSQYAYHKNFKRRDEFLEDYYAALAAIRFLGGEQ